MHMCLTFQHMIDDVFRKHINSFVLDYLEDVMVLETLESSTLVHCTQLKIYEVFFKSQTCVLAYVA